MTRARGCCKLHAVREELPAGFLLSVVMPVYNEQATLREIVAAVLAESTPKELVLVDDGSVDRSRALLDELEAHDAVRLLRHERNLGKGAALRTGFAAARGEVVLVQDADLEYDPRDYATLLRPIVRGDADVVYGSRYLIDPRDPARPRDTMRHYLVNRALTFFSNLWTGLNLTDMETCYKCFRRSALDGVRIRSNGFAVEPELTAKFARLPLRIHEVPIRYRGRGHSDGKKIGWRDGLAAIAAVLRHQFAP